MDYSMSDIFPEMGGISNENYRIQRQPEERMEYGNAA